MDDMTRKKAFYAAVRSEAEAVQLMEEVTARYGEEPGFYSAYIDKDIRYNTIVSGRRRYRALRNAVRAGKVDTVLLRSADDLLVAEEYAGTVLINLAKKGVFVIVGEGVTAFSTAGMSESEIYSKMFDLYLDNLLRVFMAPLTVMEECTLCKSDKRSWIYLISDAEKAENSYPLSYVRQSAAPTEKRMILENAVQSCKDGFYFYRNDIESWYFVESNGVSFLKHVCEENMLMRKLAAFEAVDWSID